MKRLIVYFHYDPLGQIDTACRVAVEAMAHYGEVFFISNSTLRPPTVTAAAASARSGSGCVPPVPSRVTFSMYAPLFQYFPIIKRIIAQIGRAVKGRVCGGLPFVGCDGSFALISRLRAAASVYALRAAAKSGGCAPTRACGRSPKGEPKKVETPRPFLSYNLYERGRRP